MARIPLENAYWFQEGPGVRKWQFRENGIKLINVGNISPDGHLDLDKTDRYLEREECETKYKHFLIEEGDLVIASSGITIQEDGYLKTKSAFVREKDLPLCLNTSTIRFKPRKNISDLNYLRHWLNSNDFRFQITKQVTGIAQKNFGPSHLKKITIDLPPLAEQKRIAAILDKAESIRQKRQQSIQLLNDYLRSVFLEMFGDPVENPKGWPVGKLEDFCEGKYGIKAGPFGSSLKKEVYTTSGFRVYGQEQVIAGDFSKVTYYISNEKFNEMKAYEVKPSDILVSLVGTFGKTVVAPKDVAPGIINPRLLKITVQKNKLNSQFLSFMLSMRSIQSKLIEVSHGGTMGILNATLFKSLKIYSPTISLQNKFVDIYKAANDQICSRIIETESELSVLSNSLVEKYLYGDV